MLPAPLPGDCQRPRILRSPAGEYGGANLLRRIFRANRNQIADADLIFPGQTVRIPKGV
jgi:hypothetical protein